MYAATNALPASPAAVVGSGAQPRAALRRDRAGDAVFRAPFWASRRTRAARQSAPEGAIRPSRIEVRGAAVRVVWGWQGWRDRTWQRGHVGFVCSSRTIDDQTGPAQLILVVDKLRDEGAVAAVLSCDAFTPETFAALTRHLRNFEAIGDAERSSADPLARLRPHLNPRPGSSPSQFDSLR
ncbi:hypothetical protein MTS1_02450 [Microbacterium sp. TS-1]|uniref:hypothetical protein n=1 Tax=Microbacterium sp. TS-1 TaxID=1344956 RepID=UPI00038FC082|nr:hypothetical protein [Microbacterium sp. TS-1]GAD35078.1 hypothetical protein MTS1_02450 [Microbacterium sp. TS-1]